MKTRAILCAALLAASPGALVAQSTGPASSSFVASVGVATGSASFTCGSCDDRDAGLSLFAHAGVAVAPAVEVGAELTWWTTEFDDPRGEGEASVTFLNAIARWHPKPDLGLFVKGGGGIGWIRDEADLDGIPTTLVVKTTNPSLVVGAGWDIPVGGRFSVTPYFDWNAALESDQDVNDAPTTDRLGTTILQVGVAITLK